MFSRVLVSDWRAWISPAVHPASSLPVHCRGLALPSRTRLTQPGVTVPIASAVNLDQFNMQLCAVALKLTEAHVAQLTAAHDYQSRAKLSARPCDQVLRCPDDAPIICASEQGNFAGHREWEP